MEIAAPWSRIVDVFDRTRAALLAVPHAVAATCHLSHSYLDGACLYFTFAATPPADDVESTYVALWDAGQRTVLAAGGNLSHHHGIGINRGRFAAEALGPAHGVLVALKAALDPNGILNPGKLGLPSPFGPVAMAVNPQRWDVPAIKAGGMVCLVFAVPFSIGSRWAADRDDSTLATFLVIGAVLGFVLGAGCAAWVQRVGLPLSHGIVTAVGTYLVAQTVFVLIRLVRGSEVRWFALLFNLSVTVRCRAGRRRHRRTSAGEGFPPETHAGRAVILVIDIGTTGLRAALVDDTTAIRALHYRPFPPSTPAPGLVEFDATEMGRLVLDAAGAAIADAGADAVTAVGITNQRASTIVWDRSTGATDRAGARVAGPAHRRRMHHGQDRARTAAGTEPVGDEDRLVAGQHA